MTLRVVVVDDEDLPRQRIVDLVRRTPDLELVGEADDGANALDRIEELRPDLVFLDIQLPELDGFELVAALGKSRLPAIVFVTAYDEYAVRAFEVDAIDYLLKPVRPERFTEAVQRVRARASGARDNSSLDASIRSLASRAVADRGYPTRFVARRGSKHYFVRVADVDWIDADGNYARLHTASRSHLIRETMKSIASRLDPARFVRIHRSAIVAVDAIETIEARDQGEYVVTVRGGVKLVSSRGYSANVRSLLQ
jgi:two-component system, LytTR family, response regulator